MAASLRPPVLQSKINANLFTLSFFFCEIGPGKAMCKPKKEIQKNQTQLLLFMHSEMSTFVPNVITLRPDEHRL